jgi:hypothetical protein
MAATERGDDDTWPRTKRLVDIDNDLLEEATTILRASTMKEASIDLSSPDPRPTRRAPSDSGGLPGRLTETASRRPSFWNRTSRPPAVTSLPAGHDYLVRQAVTGRRQHEAGREVAEEFDARTWRTASSAAGMAFESHPLPPGARLTAGAVDAATWQRRALDALPRRGRGRAASDQRRTREPRSGGAGARCYLSWRSPFARTATKRRLSQRHQPSSIP